jgi:hypothetical protein
MENRRKRMFIYHYIVTYLAHIGYSAYNQEKHEGYLIADNPIAAENIVKNEYCLHNVINVTLTRRNCIEIK